MLLITLHEEQLRGRHVRSCLVNTQMSFASSLISALVVIIALNYGLRYRGSLWTSENQTSQLVSAVIYEYENFDNNLLHTVANVCLSIPRVFVLSDTFIYPPVDFSSLLLKCQVELVERGKSPLTAHTELDLHGRIRSEYVLLIPDASRLVSESLLQRWALHSLQASTYDGLLFPVYPGGAEHEDVTLICHPISFDVKRWTLHYEKASKFCEYSHENGLVLLIRTSSLFKTHRPFSRPFARAFAIQSHLANLSIKLENKRIFTQDAQLYGSERLRAKHDQLEHYRVTQLYEQLGIKKVHNHSDNLKQWFGCDRHRPRCFGTIVDDTPDYLIRGRWTPPCCYANLEVTGRYVIGLLAKFGVRHWLEGGSLLGAARNGEIIPWDYDIDLGIYRQDSAKLSILSKLLASQAGAQIEDGQGFLWEKALEGDFIKVHLSRVNRVHVDIFPFESINGTMTKDTWFDNHPQDMPFPEHYLQPLSKIWFIGIEVAAPNNVTQFLEMKFGKGAIEQPKYPRPLIGLDHH